MSTTEETLDEGGMLDSIQVWLRDRLLTTVDTAVEARRAYWASPDRERPTPDDVRRLIRNAANKNAAIAGSTTLVPGPVGVVTIPAELLLTLRTSVELVFDIAVAHGREAAVDTEVIVAVAMSDAGGGLVGLIFEEGDKTIVKRPARKLLRKLSALMARQLAKRLLRVFFGRLVPVFGALGVAWWTRSRTMAVGYRAADVFDGEVVVVDATEAEDIELSRELDEWMDEPDFVVESSELSTARHAMVANLLRRSALPSAEQLERFDALCVQWAESGAAVGTSEEVLAAEDDLPTNLALLASADSAEVIFGDLAAFASLGAGMPRQWAYDLGASFGMQPSEVDDILADPPSAQNIDFN